MSFSPETVDIILKICWKPKAMVLSAAAQDAERLAERHSSVLLIECVAQQTVIPKATTVKEYILLTITRVCRNKLHVLMLLFCFVFLNQ